MDMCGEVYKHYVYNSNGVLVRGENIQAHRTLGAGQHPSVARMSTLLYQGR